MPALHCHAASISIKVMIDRMSPESVDFGARRRPAAARCQRLSVCVWAFSDSRLF